MATDNATLKPRLVSRLPTFREDALSDDLPPWHPLTVHQLADKLGVTVQALANWRYRSNGPAFRLTKKRRCIYRMCDVLEWLTGEPAWFHSKHWLVERGMIPEDADELYVEWVMSLDPAR